MLRELSSATLVAWGNAWLTGQAGLDDAVDTVEHGTGPHILAAPDTGLVPGVTGEQPLRNALADLRSHGISALRLCLPVPGDPLGLVGEAELNIAAIEAREAVLVRMYDRQLGLVPAEDRRGSSYVGVRWTPYPATDTTPQIPSLPEAEQQLTHAIRDCIPLFEQVTELADWGPEVTAALEDLRDPRQAPGDGLPPGSSQRAHRVAALAERLTVVVRLADADAGTGITTHQIATHATALRMLDRAVRRARVAAYGAANQ
ncbi:hypothetical protein [Lipingzhangella rawalii]|uniref:hypothetical protein n=1 Tax=Lipingzhangella rawalii TaxID=2055835 RepID=UPI00287B5EA6|nr:hypothetical protein [Lipingzhangella rawalii]